MELVALCERRAGSLVLAARGFPSLPLAVTLVFALFVSSPSASRLRLAASTVRVAAASILSLLAARAVRRAAGADADALTATVATATGLAAPRVPRAAAVAFSSR